MAAWAADTPTKTIKTLILPKDIKSNQCIICRSIEVDTRKRYVLYDKSLNTKTTSVNVIEKVLHCQITSEYQNIVCCKCLVKVRSVEKKQTDIENIRKELGISFKANIDVISRIYTVTRTKRETHSYGFSIIRPSPRKDRPTLATASTPTKIPVPKTDISHSVSPKAKRGLFTAFSPSKIPVSSTKPLRKRG